MTVPLSVTVRLRAGVVGGASLPDPDNRRMQPNKDYVVTWDVFEQISGGALKSIVQVQAMTTTPTAVDGTDLTTNTPALPAGQKLGRMVYGHYDYNKFKLVQLTGGTAATAGSVLAWANKAADTVTAVHSATSEFAGVALGAITSGNYGWVQIDGVAPVVQSSGAANTGDPVALDPAAAGKARAATGTDKAFGSSLATIAAAGNVDATLRASSNGRRLYQRKRSLFARRN